jgi:drug/metabolite transporter (DMT)-like permease
MSWWTYALLSAACWGLQYVLMEALFRKIDFASAFSFLSLANGILIAAVLWLFFPRQNWLKLGESWSVIGLLVTCLFVGTGAYVFNALAINQKNATLASLLELSYPLFVTLFTALFFRQVHLNPISAAGAALIFFGCILIVFSRAL